MGVSKEELAALSGASADDVDRLCRLGILAPTEGETPFVPADVRRVKLARSCERAGLSLEGVGAAIRAGKLSFAFLDLPSFRWSPLSDKSYRNVAEESRLPLDLLLDLQEAMGSVRPDPDAPMRQDDLEALPALQLALATQVADEGLLLRAVRVYAESIRRITDMEAQLYHANIETPMLRSGLDQRQMMEVAADIGAQFVPLTDRALQVLYDRMRERSWTEDLVSHIEAALEEAGLHHRLERPPAMCFLDLAGFTRVTEEQGDEAAAELAATLASMVQRESQRYEGQPVKWLGDGVMFHFKDAKGAVLSALEMVERASAVGLPPAHVGVAAGPVISQDGDFFGRTVNKASRIAARAGPGQVLVGEEVVHLAGGAATFREIGPATLKGILKPATLYEALPL